MSGLDPRMISGYGWDGLAGFVWWTPDVNLVATSGLL